MHPVNERNSGELYYQVYGDTFGLPSMPYIGYAQFPTAAAQTWHLHHGLEFIIVSEGGTSYELDDGRVVELSGGMFSQIAPEQHHRAKDNLLSPHSGFWIQILPPELHTSFDSALEPEIYRQLLASSYANNGKPLAYSDVVGYLLHEFYECLELYAVDPSDIINTAKLRSVICHIILELHRSAMLNKEPVIDDDVQRIIEYMNSHYLDEMSFEHVLTELNLRRSGTFEKFRRLTGHTPNDYFQRIRITRAQELMWQEDLSLTQIAFESGFNSSNYFSHMFKRYTRMTPRMYRNEIVGLSQDSAEMQMDNDKSVKIDLNPYFNSTGIYNDGSVFKEGLDGNRYAYSGKLMPNPILWNGHVHRIGAPEQPNIVVGRGQVIPLPTGKYQQLDIIATSWCGARELHMTVNYSDGTSTDIRQTVSDWCWANGYESESIVLVMWHRAHGDGTTDSQSCYIYGYMFQLAKTKEIESITLADSGAVAILSMLLA